MAGSRSVSVDWWCRPRPAPARGGDGHGRMGHRAGQAAGHVVVALQGPVRWATRASTFYSVYIYFVSVENE
jgi:hypothetical protein